MEAGFSNVKTLEGGIAGWKAAGFPVEGIEQGNRETGNLMNYEDVP